MPRLKHSIAWWCFVPARLTAHELIATAADLGYDAIEMPDPQHYQLIRDHGLAIASISAHASIENGLNDRSQHDRIEREIGAALRAAERWHIPNLICFSGSRNGLADQIGAEITAEGLRRVARSAEDAGVTLVLELLNSKIDHPDYQCDHTAWGAQVCQMVGSSRVKLLYDVYHMQIMEGDLIRTVEAHHDQIGHYHIAGNPGRHEPDGTQEINYPAIMPSIAATGYDGYIGHEYVPQNDPIAALKRSLDLCRVT